MFLVVFLDFENLFWHIVLHHPMQVIPDITQDKLALCLPELDTEEGTLELQLWSEWYTSAVRAALANDSQGQSQVKIQRTATAWFLRALNNVLLQVTGQGLEAFASDAGGMSLHRNWQAKQGIPPCLSIATDQASVCFASLHALQKKLGVIAEMTNDPSHRVTNDLMLALKLCGPWWECIMLLSIPCKDGCGLPGETDISC